MGKIPAAKLLAVKQSQTNKQTREESTIEFGSKSIAWIDLRIIPMDSGGSGPDPIWPGEVLWIANIEKVQIEFIQST